MKAGTMTICVAVLAVCYGIPAKGQQLSKAYGRVRPSVVVVRAAGEELSGDVLMGFVRSSNEGPGVLVSSDGLVLTTAQLVQTADQIVVEFSEGRSTSARVETSSPLSNLALLKLDEAPEGIAPAAWGDSDKVELGDEVFMVGMLPGGSQSLSVGHISSRYAPRNLIGNMVPLEFLQMDVQAPPRFAGAPDFNTAGELIGLASQHLSQVSGFEGLNFVVTSNVCRQVLLGKQSFWSGMDAVLLAGQMADIFNIDQGAGLLVQRVAKESPASRLGLRPGYVQATVGNHKVVLGGDIILEFMDLPMAGDGSNIKLMQEALEKLKPGEKMRVKILRAGEIIELSMDWK